LLRTLAAAAAGVVVAIALAACGTGGISKGSADVQNGKRLFLGKGQCGGCHTLSAAGSSGTIGPNLDDAFAQARADGYKESAIRNIVHEQIKYPGQYETAQKAADFLSANMPANLVRGQDAEDVAAFVAANAGLQGFTVSQQVSGTNGKQIFKTKCGGCHTLKDAGTSGTIGPNLDALKPSFSVAQNQVIHGGGAMPAFKGVLTDAQIKAVAKYVSSRAAK
jgi:cbb3-type cytochrome c oxidase subunit III